MNAGYIPIDDVKKSANFDKVLAERDMYKSDYLILKDKSKENDKKYLKVIEEKNKRIAELENELSKFKGKQINIFDEV